VACADGTYAYLGIVNQGDRAGMQIWSGVNSAGFAIMNNATYNLDIDGEKTTQEGSFMKVALQTCATVEAFQALLERSNSGGREVSANFGVIDAQGGAAYFETDNKGFHRFDAAAAPGGFLVRGNYSHSGRKGGGTGYLREARAQELIQRLQSENRLAKQDLLAEVARDTANSFSGSYPADLRKGFAFVGDSVSREETSCAFLIQGVAPGEAPARTTAWVVLGLPITGVAVPLWVSAGPVPAELAAGRALAPLNAAFERVRLAFFPFPETDRHRYLDAGRAYAPGTGLVPQLVALERDNLVAVDRAFAAPQPDLKALQDGIARHTLERVEKLLKDAGLPAR
jgi:hypothetical protein